LDTAERAEIYQLHAEFCKTLADANRLLIINELSKGELSVTEITRRLDLQQSNVSKHLSLMREHGLVNSRREGSTVYYSLSDRRISEAIKLLKAAQADQMERRRRLTINNR
jgi:DNA-binding transcriptional ArsR family regulator